MHNWNEQIGKFLELKEDEKGLRFVAKLGTSQRGEDALRDYQEGILREHSIGFRYVSDGLNWVNEDKNDVDDEEMGYWNVSEVMLWEGSGVTFGANPFTEVINVAKSGGIPSQLEKLNGEMNAIQKSLRHGKGSDDRFYRLEMRLAHVTDQIFILSYQRCFDDWYTAYAELITY